MIPFIILPFSESYGSQAEPSIAQNYFTMICLIGCQMPIKSLLLLCCMAISLSHIQMDIGFGGHFKFCVSVKNHDSVA